MSNYQFMCVSRFAQCSIKKKYEQADINVFSLKVLEEAAHQASAQANDVFPHPAKSHLLQLSEIMKKDRFDDLFDNEKHLLW